MNIVAEDLGMRFMKRWLFQNLQLNLTSGTTYAITGANGSGKSTLLQLLIGLFPPSKGRVSYYIDNQIIDIDKVYSYFSVSTPSMELIDDFTLSELWDFHSKFKKPIFSKNDFIQKTRFDADKNKQIKYYSSGMKQRLKLGLCFYFESLGLFFDEPTSNLDRENIKWFLEEIKILVNQKNRLIVICSNVEEEYSFCDYIVNLS